MSVRITGLDNVQRRLRDLKERAEGLSGSHSVKFEELFTPSFMAEHTDFGTIDEMVSASGFTVETAEDFAKIPDDDWDRFVAERTRFTTWKDMMTKAGQQWAARRLGF